jgi:hypothetical protein
MTGMNTVLAWVFSRGRDMRGLWSRVRWLGPDLLKVTLAVSAGALAFVLFSRPQTGYAAFFTDVSNYGVFFEAVSITSLLYGGIALWVRTRTTMVFDRLAPLDKTSVAPQPDELISVHQGQAIVYSPAINQLLESSSNPVVFTEVPFDVHPLVRELLPSFILSMPETTLDTSDDAKVRLYTDLTVDLLRGSGKVFLQRTSYFRDRLSNTLANYRVRLDGRELLNLRQEAVDADRRLVSLKESTLSNQLGSSTLLITADSTIVFLRQGNRVAENAGRLAPAGSGSFDLPKQRSNLNFQAFARDEAKRELCEECGLTSGDVVAIHLCGYGRYLYRNGKPELFCIAVTGRSSQSIEVPLREWDYQQRHVERHGFEGNLSAANVVRGLDKLRLRLEKGGPGFEQVSGPLYWSVLFAREYLAGIDGTREKSLFDGVQ